MLVLSFKDVKALVRLCESTDVWKVVVVDAKTWTGGPILRRLPECGLIVSAGLETPWHETISQLEIINP